MEKLFQLLPSPCLPGLDSLVILVPAEKCQKPLSRLTVESLGIKWQHDDSESSALAPLLKEPSRITSADSQAYLNPAHPGANQGPQSTWTWKSGIQPDEHVEIRFVTRRKLLSEQGRGGTRGDSSALWVLERLRRWLNGVLRSSPARQGSPKHRSEWP